MRGERQRAQSMGMRERWSVRGVSDGFTADSCGEAEARGCSEGEGVQQSGWCSAATRLRYPLSPRL